MLSFILLLYICFVDPKPVTNLRSLQSLDISFCPKITDASLSEFTFPDLRRLNISSNTGKFILPYHFQFHG